MESLGLLCGHLLGDYILQNDWQAANKTVFPPPDAGRKITQRGFFNCLVDYWRVRRWFLVGDFACTIHCILYTLAVWVCSCWWMPWWGLAICFLAHWPIDRFRLAAWWMKNISGQSAFVEKMAPWSVIIVDNTWHLLTLFVIGLLAR